MTRTGLALSLAAAVACCAGLGCDFFIEPAPDVEHPKEFDLEGITISYPGNWKAVREVEKIEEITMTTATFESGGHATAIVQHMKPGIPVAGTDWAGEYMKGIQQASGEELGGLANVGESVKSPVTHSILGEEREGTRQVFNISLLGESVPHSLDLYPVELEDRTIIFLSQVATEDEAKARPAFDLILDSAKKPK